MDIEIIPSVLKGRLTIPPSKSLTMRAIYLAFLAKGTSTLHNVLLSPDTNHFLKIVETLGGSVTQSGTTLRIRGVDNTPIYSAKPLYCGNSGIILRFMTGLACRFSSPLYLYGDKELNQHRPMGSLADCICSAKGNVYHVKKNGRAPLLVAGPLKKSELKINGKISQPVSSMILHQALQLHSSTLCIDSFEEKNWVLMTLSFLKRLNIPFSWKDEQTLSFPGKASFSAFNYTVPQDMSTLSFPLIAMILSKEPVYIDSLFIDQEQKESLILDLVKQMGVKLSYNGTTLKCEQNSILNGISADINEFNDALPILSVLACFCDSPSRFYGASTSRHKECDRIAAITHNLRKMGANIQEHDDGINIFPSTLYGTTLGTYNDHRIALSSIIASCFAKTSSIIYNVDCISKTYPNFLEEWKKINLNVQPSTSSSVDSHKLEKQP